MNAAALDLPGLQYDTMTALGDLADLLPLVDDLTDTHQRGLGFLTPEARTQLDAQVAADRHALRTQPARPTVGLKWLNRDRDVIPSGHVRAPGNVAALSWLAETATALHHHTRRILATTPSHAANHDDRAELSARDLIALLRDLIPLSADTDRLTALWRDAEHLVDDARRLVDGDDKSLLEDPCPHCDNHTLVVHWTDDLIRCGRELHTGQLRRCTCPDPLCECKTAPIAYRHTWHRTATAAGDRRNTWAALNNLLTTRRAATAHEGTTP